MIMQIQPLPYLVFYRAPRQGIPDWCIEAQFLNERDAEQFAKLPHAGQREIFLRKEDYDRLSAWLPSIREKYRDRTV